MLYNGQYRLIYGASHTNWSHWSHCPLIAISHQNPWKDSKRYVFWCFLTTYFWRSLEHFGDGAVWCFFFADQHDVFFLPKIVESWNKLTSIGLWSQSIAMKLEFKKRWSDTSSLTMRHGKSPFSNMQLKSTIYHRKWYLNTLNTDLYGEYMVVESTITGHVPALSTTFWTSTSLQKDVEEARAAGTGERGAAGKA